MTATSTIQTAFAAMLTTHTDLAVAVELGTQTGNGLRVLSDKQTDAGEMMQGGSTSGTVRVSAATFDEPTRGAHLKVATVQVYVLDCRTSGGIRVIDYTETNPVEGV